MAGEYELRGLAVPDSLEQLHDLLEGVRADWPDIDEEDVSMFETAIIEIHGNVVEHGRPEGKVLYVFRLEVHPDRLVGTLADTGEEVPDLTGAVEGTHRAADLDESGRGLWLAHATLDELDYARVDDQNTWRLVRRRGREVTRA